VRYLALLTLAVAIAPAGVLLGPATLAGDDMSGGGQAGEAGSRLARPLAVQVTRDGAPVADAVVRFEVLSEPLENRGAGRAAALGDSIVRTDRLGFARTTLTLGETPGDYRVRASGPGGEHVFAATALGRRWYLVTSVQLAGGLCLFLFGLYYGSKGLRRLAGRRLRELLFSLTSNRVLGALAGVVVTLAFQSSTATVSLLVGMGSAGILGLSQALGVVLGADLGTTVTVQALSFRLFDYALVVAVAGFLLMNAGRRLRDVGQAVFGFGLVFWSLQVVMDASRPLQYVPEVGAVVARVGSAPLAALVFATLFTALLRSSAATIGMVVGLSFAGLVDLRAAIPFILGANLGTTANALVASWRAGAEARRIAVGHVLFKVLTVALLLPFLPLLARLVAATAASVPRQVANAHTLINVFALALFLPLLGPLERLVRALVPDRPVERFGPRYIDQSALEAPDIAVAQAAREVLHMGDLVLGMYREALRVFIENDKEGRRRVVVEDDRVDELEVRLTAFLARIQQEELTPELARKTKALFSAVDELEHIADVVSKSLTWHARKKTEEGLAFSNAGLEEIRSFHTEVGANLETALACLATWNRSLAQKLVAAREVGLERQRQLQDAHRRRLTEGVKETLDTSSVHLDMVADLERVNFFCSQIGSAVLAAKATDL
jgi:phosphate:Na+ symporter